MRYPIRFTDDAVRDLEGLYAYLEAHVPPGRADEVLDQIEATCMSLAELPEQ